ncbi:MAG: hypothetical protein FJ335_08970 [Sphingomonadales bacterium]|nr:hypothetical protein [Sphingomonadales bacterium]
MMLIYDHSHAADIAHGLDQANICSSLARLDPNGINIGPLTDDDAITLRLIVGPEPRSLVE